MITLSLLSPQQKLKIRKAYLYDIIENFIAIILIVIVIIAIISLVAKLLLERKFYSLVVGSSAYTIQDRELNKKISLANRQLEIIFEVQKNLIEWSDILINFSNIIPKDIQIKTLGINKIGDQVFKIDIGGIAKTRVGLLDFQKKLEDSPLFTEVQSPLSNLLKKQDITFEFSAQLNINSP